MKIKDTLQRDPATHPLVNQGQARIADQATDEEVSELKGELSTFVCEGEYREGLQRILQSYLTCLTQSGQKAAWVSGFFGSGKSHLLKMLCHLWQDTAFPDGSTARGLVPSLPDDIRAMLMELDTQGRRSGGLFAAAGALPGGTTDNVRLTVLSILLRGAGFPEQYAQARFVLWLHEREFLVRVKEAVEQAGKDWLAELNNLYVSGPIAKAIMACDKDFASSEAEARKSIREQFKQPTGDITTADFLSMVRQVLELRGRDGRFPCTILVLDEVQQYIGSSAERSTLVTEVVEALNHQLESQVLVVGAGQSALSEQQLLHKLLDRFPVRVQLSDTDVETVTRKVLLQKKPSAVAKVQELLDKHDGEIARQLHDTQIAARADDRETAVDDYPLLPVRRRFWELVFRAVDLAGTHSQLRSQLRIIHDAVANSGERSLGAVVPADELFTALAPEMVNTGVLLRELNDRISKVGAGGTESSRLRQRLCGMVFLIGRLPRDAGADIGVRASAAHLADLLIDDLSANNSAFRAKIEAEVQALAEDGTLMRLGDEYRLQTREGTDWDKDFRNFVTKLNNDDITLQTERERHIYGGVAKVLDRVKILHGKAKEVRKLQISREQTPPTEDGEGIQVWIRDGWATTEKGFVDEARRAGQTGGVVYLFIPKHDDADFRQTIIEAMAAHRTLGQKGHPVSPEGQEARRSMESRLAAAMQRRDQILDRIINGGKVFQGGGHESLGLELQDRITAAAEAALDRLFPRFGEADAAASQWESAIKRAREGADQPFQPAGYTGPIEGHPVCVQVGATIGAGASGTAVRKALRASPFGWPQDAIDAALIALHQAQVLTATLNGQAVVAGQLDQNRIPKAEFRREVITLGASDRIRIRGVYKQAGVDCKPNEELGRAEAFLTVLAQLRASSTGDAPLPPAPADPLIDELRSNSGTSLLAFVNERAADLKAWIEKAQHDHKLAGERLPIWAATIALARHAAGLPAASDTLAEIEAVQSERMLLAKTDRVTPLRTRLADLLREAFNGARERCATAHEQGLGRLEADPTWQAINASDQARLLTEAHLLPLPAEEVRSDEALLAALDRQALAARAAQADAVPGRVQRALETAARLLEPKVRTVSLERGTLRSETEVRAWLERQENALLAEIKLGPVLLN